MSWSSTMYDDLQSMERDIIPNVRSLAMKRTKNMMVTFTVEVEPLV